MSANPLSPAKRPSFGDGALRAAADGDAPRCPTLKELSAPSRPPGQVKRVWPAGLIRFCPYVRRLHRGTAGLFMGWHLAKAFTFQLLTNLDVAHPLKADPTDFFDASAWIVHNDAHEDHTYH